MNKYTDAEFDSWIKDMDLNYTSDGEPINPESNVIKLNKVCKVICLQTYRDTRQIVEVK